MNQRDSFYEAIKVARTIILATADDKRVSMRTVSPVFYEKNILIFTSPKSLKYQQLQKNSRCCVAIENFFAEASAQILGPTMLKSNEKFRVAYNEKFPGAFEEGIEFGGRSSEFILLRIMKLKGWSFDNEVPSAEEIPSIPFEIDFC